MTHFSSSPLMDSFPSPRFSDPPSPTKTETDLPIEVDQSFNSSMSLGDTSPYFSPTPAMLTSKPSASASAASSLLSPTPPPAFSLKPRRPDPVPVQVRPRPSPSRSKSTSEAVLGSRALGQGRSFGRELSINAAPRPAGMMAMKSGAGKGGFGVNRMLPPAVPEGKALKARGSVPMQWTSSNEELGDGSRGQLGVPRTESDPSLGVSPRSNRSYSDDMMDVDSPQVRPTSMRRTSLLASPVFDGPTSVSGSPELGSFFCNTPGPQAAPAKRRSLVTSTPASPSSSSPSAKRTSLGLGLQRPPLDKTASSSAMLFGGGRTNTIAARRAPAYKRPTLGPLAAASNADGGIRTASASSAFPILYGPPKHTLGSGGASGSSSSGAGTFPRAAVAPMRRAFSVCDQNAVQHELDEEESEYENSPSVGAHAEYMRRYGRPGMARGEVDGSPGFKSVSVRASIAASGEGVSSPVGKGRKVSPYGPGGLPGFGDNELEGKILPCHKVKEDGLVRISSETLDSLLEGKYDNKIKRYHVIDCRFDYEYAGGHIAGAINVKSMDALDQLLLSEQEGVHANGDKLPEPSRSGQLGDGEQVVLVFHCEFSAKRAPTFAKHLRSRDRSINGAVYPKIYYPEVYILEGGYCGFYQDRPERCDPKGYTPMDDPKHFERRNSDLHDFRKFSRTRSFTYGEQATLPSSRVLPPCPPLAFAAASAAAARRGGATAAGGSGTIAEEDHEHDSANGSALMTTSASGSGSSPHPGDSSAEMDSGAEASPCPRQVVSMSMAPPIFGSARPRTLGRLPMHRVQTYAGGGTGAGMLRQG
ncbi:hypothetical protein IAT38_001213 [Cryptococcus sp. DSM 104549]